VVKNLRIGHFPQSAAQSGHVARDLAQPKIKINIEENYKENQVFPRQTKNGARNSSRGGREQGFRGK